MSGYQEKMIDKFGKPFNSEMDFQQEIRNIEIEEKALKERRKNLVSRQLWEILSEDFEKLEYFRFNRDARTIFCVEISKTIDGLDDETIESVRSVMKIYK